MATIYEYTTYHVTYLNELNALTTLNFNTESAAADFANQLSLNNCEFVHFYKSETVTMFYKDDSTIFVC